jgi:CRISPR-associated protein Cmr3
MRLFIEPNDVWLFRDGRPFDVFAEHRARTIFPPFPTVVQGMIRSAHLAFCGVALEDYLNGKAPQNIVDAIGKPSAPASFTLRGPFVAKREADGKLEQYFRYFPRPADSYWDGKRYVALHPSSPAGIASNLPEGLQLLYPRQKNPPADALQNWWHEDDLKNYLAEKQVVLSNKFPAVFARESRVGIHLQSDIRRPRDGFIYEIEYARLTEGFGLVVKVEGLPEDQCDQWPPTGLVRFGGDGRAARFSKISAEISFPQMKGGANNTKLYFATPTYFKNGWEPESWQEFFEGDAKPMAAALEKPFVLGSIDLAKAEKGSHEMHRPSRRYVPAGSVYFFAGEIKLKKDAVADDGANIGFGQIILGRW